MIASLCSPRFGKLPDGARLERISRSPNYRDGKFHNQIPTSMLIEGESQFSVLVDFLLHPRERLKPERPLPVVATDLKVLDPAVDVVVWLGHSSTYLHIDGRRILIDPVFSRHAAPFSLFNRAFEGEYPYSAESMPDIDYLILSHDHWDHLDYPTLKALLPRVGAVICPLGVGSHLEYWGFPAERIHEGDWYDTIELEPGFTVHVLPARHFSGRWLTRDKTLWAGFMLVSPKRKVFYSGDSGYGPQYREAGERFGELDLAIMENGQYDPKWAQIHQMPEETARAAVEVRARAMLPVHSGRFSITNHAWDAPFQRITAASRDAPYSLLTPMIGEPVNLDDIRRLFPRWWEQE